jgi:hypothetical protein
MFDNPPMATTTATPHEARRQLDAKQENFSALACHLHSYVKKIPFNTKVEEAEWCQSNIKVDIILWHSNTINLMKTASTKVCRLCTAEHMINRHNFNSAHQQNKIINLKSKLREICNCKTRFLRFEQSD